MKDKKEIAKEWALVNARLMSEIQFSKKNDGMSFGYFHRNNKKECMLAWNELMKQKKSENKKAHKKLEDCQCEYESKQPANASRGSDEAPMRLWKCSKHGNTFKML